MLSYEWRELETLCQRISDLRERYSEARRSRNVGLTASLKVEVDAAQRQREQLVQHISARLAPVAAEQHPVDAVSRARRQRAAASGEKPAGKAKAEADPIVGFEDS